MKKYLSLLLALLFSIGILAGCAQENPSNTDTESHEGNSETTAAPATPEKKYCEITIDDLFADDTVSLCLMPQYNDKAYTIEDFPELNISAMRETVFESFPENEPRRWIILTLSEPSKENVIAAIRALEKRADVFCAEPDSYSTPSATPNDILYNIPSP